MQHPQEDTGGLADMPAGGRAEGTLQGVHMEEEGDGYPGLAAGGIGDNASAEDEAGGIAGAGSEVSFCVVSFR